MELDVAYKVINQIFPISALTGYGTELLLQKSKIYLKNKKNTSLKKTVQIKKEIFYAEVTREKIFDKVHKEIPYYCDIITDKIINQQSLGFSSEQSLMKPEETDKFLKESKVI